MKTSKEIIQELREGLKNIGKNNEERKLKILLLILETAKHKTEETLQMEEAQNGL